MKRIAITTLFALTACARSVSVGTDKTMSVTSQIADAAGKAVGTATFSQRSNGVAIDVNVWGLPAGVHGLHIHPIGNCDPTNNYAAAGLHMNPTNRQHGLNNPAGPHDGDLPNLTIDQSGKGTLHTVNERITLTQLRDADGSSILIHVDPDDNMSQPAGNSGAKIACGRVS